MLDSAYGTIRIRKITEIDGKLNKKAWITKEVGDWATYIRLS